MQQNYIHEPNAPISIVIRKGKPFKVKPAKRHEVPKSYQKPINKKLEFLLTEAALYWVGFTELIRKETSLWAPWKKTEKQYKQD